MPRNPAKKEEEKKEFPEMPDSSKGTEKEVVVEREITMSLLNDKINYMTSVLHKIAEACECDLS